jgi:predicted small secreted protein
VWKQSAALDGDAAEDSGGLLGSNTEAHPMMRRSLLLLLALVLCGCETYRTWREDHPVAAVALETAGGIALLYAVSRAVADGEREPQGESPNVLIKCRGSGDPIPECMFPEQYIIIPRGP